MHKKNAFCAANNLLLDQTLCMGSKIKVGKPFRIFRLSGVLSLYHKFSRGLVFVGSWIKSVNIPDSMT